MGSGPNVGLMAQQAEEYGSHDTTFEMVGDGAVTVRNSAGDTLLSHDVEEGDVWSCVESRMAQSRIGSACRQPSACNGLADRVLVGCSASARCGVDQETRAVPSRS